MQHGRFFNQKSSLWQWNFHVIFMICPWISQEHMTEQKAVITWLDHLGSLVIQIGFSQWSLCTNHSDTQYYTLNKSACSDALQQAHMHQLCEVAR